jgi:hypothetical protein
MFLLCVLYSKDKSQKRQDKEVRIKYTHKKARWGARFFSPVHTGPGAHPASYKMGTGSFPGVKRPWRGVNHPPPSNVSMLK